MRGLAAELPIAEVNAAACRIPTSTPEGDGTYAWDSTTMVVTDVKAGDSHGLGYTCADSATGRLIQDSLAPALLGRDAMDVPAAWVTMVHAVRNLGRPGVSSMAISAVDVLCGSCARALWSNRAA